jgi:hypothetical protein
LAGEKNKENAEEKRGRKRASEKKRGDEIEGVSFPNICP